MKIEKQLPAPVKNKSLTGRQLVKWDKLSWLVIAGVLMGTVKILSGDETTFSSRSMPYLVFLSTGILNTILVSRNIYTPFSRLSGVGIRYTIFIALSTVAVILIAAAGMGSERLETAVVSGLIILLPHIVSEVWVSYQRVRHLRLSELEKELHFQNADQVILLGDVTVRFTMESAKAHNKESFPICIAGNIKLQQVFYEAFKNNCCGFQLDNDQLKIEDPEKSYWDFYLKDLFGTRRRKLAADKSLHDNDLFSSCSILAINTGRRFSIKVPDWKTSLSKN